MTPDQLVLGSGGVLGDTWMSGLVAGLLDAGGPDLRQAGRFVGTSAGSIVATRLAAGEDMRSYIERRFSVTAGKGNPSHDSSGADPEVGSGALSAPVARLLGVTGPAGRLLRRTALRALPEGGEELARLGRTMERLMPDWDPRLSLVGVSVDRGARVVMSGEQQLGLSVGEAVRASCAIPGVFRPIESDRGPIVDGGVWSPVNLDAVDLPAGSSVLCLYPSGYRGRPDLRRRAVAGLSRTRVSLEAATIRSRGARVLTVSPDPFAAEAIGPDRMDHERDPMVASAGFAQGRSLAAVLGGWLTSETDVTQAMHPSSAARA